MRITNRIVSNNLLSTITDIKERMSKLQIDLVTTKKLRKPSDDANGILKLERIKELRNKNDQFLRNMSHITGWINSTTVGLDSISDSLSTAREKAIQGANGTINDDVRASLANMIDQEIEKLLSLGNTNYNGKFIFGGTLTINKAPYARTGDVVTYNGNSGSIVGKIGFNTKIQYNKTGDEVFNPAGGVDIFNTLITLKQSLEQNDTSAIQSSIDILDQAITHVNSISAEYGTLENRLSLTEDILRNENTNLMGIASEIEDTNMAEAILEFQNAEAAYTSGLKIATKLVRTSLVDFLA